ncbi:Piso0_002229 [Millerozyma farinosa CBS 7064]|uniref:Piso0_002229 protein n=1 Tax=Pichia sorbitophila (strain ATCC MYA-4447 / BCRC 22081 / CBS 7064 / NBRC 10061 / NRRL Y-12695) TaxID=559304 RepID=G8YC21_PICSO|nr:Piso0_002229 [Millerozyma farinosa CBS 7064]
MISNTNRFLHRMINNMSKAFSREIRTAGCLIIGDEVLNGKILDTNSYAFAKHCFNNLNIPLRRTIVCADDKEDIKSSLRILLDQDECDLVVTSGGIGPTHDDITYSAVAEAYNIPCTIEQDIVDRMNSIRSDYISKLSEEQKKSFYRMATIPSGTQVEKIFPDQSLWVPIVGIEGRVYILPGVPRLFNKLLNGLSPYLERRLKPVVLTRYFIKTKSKESELAPFLSELQSECDNVYGKGSVKLGSYPHMEWGINTISIIGNNNVKNAELRSVVNQILENVGGEAIEIDKEEEDELSTKLH